VLGATYRDDWQDWLDCGRRRVGQPGRDKAESDVTYPEVEGPDHLAIARPLPCTMARRA